jgi:very-short-patch-repair endonuclease
MKYADRYKRKKEIKSKQFAGEMRARSDSKQRCVEFSAGERRVVELAKEHGVIPGGWSSAEHSFGKLLKRSNVHYADHVRVGPYTVDFLLPQKMVVEVEGIYHEDRGMRDAQRTDFLEKNGFYVLRIPAGEAHKKKTAELIKKICLERQK